MALEKCPRCELNYILDGDKLCTVCKREVSGDLNEVDDLPDLCSECGEAPAVPGSELCLGCLKEMARRVSTSDAVEVIDVSAVEDPALEINGVSGMDEIQIDLGGEIEEDEDFAEEEEDPFDSEDVAQEEDDDDLLDR